MMPTMTWRLCLPVTSAQQVRCPATPVATIFPVIGTWTSLPCLFHTSPSAKKSHQLCDNFSHFLHATQHGDIPLDSGMKWCNTVA